VKLVEQDRVDLPGCGHRNGSACPQLEEQREKGAGEGQRGTRRRLFVPRLVQARQRHAEQQCETRPCGSAPSGGTPGRPPPSWTVSFTADQILGVAGDRGAPGASHHAAARPGQTGGPRRRCAACTPGTASGRKRRVRRRSRLRHADLRPASTVATQPVSGMAADPKACRPVEETDMNQPDTVPEVLSADLPAGCSCWMCAKTMSGRRTRARRGARAARRSRRAGRRSATRPRGVRDLPQRRQVGPYAAQTLSAGGFSTVNVADGMTGWAVAGAS